MKIKKCEKCGNNLLPVVDIYNEKIILTCKFCFQECSCCRKWKHRSEYLTPKKRTNCETCYNLPLEEMNELSEKTNELYKSLRNRQLVSKAIEFSEYIQAAITKKELIEMLKDLSDDDLLVFSAYHDIYDTSIGRINSPEEVFELGDYKFYSLGSCRG